jgi:ABC-type bacteriocin/lantibiotic exporter with double-glycine peptidase domain
VQSLQDEIKHEEGTLAYLNQVIDDKAPKTVPKDVLDKIPQAYGVPLKNQLSIKYQGAVGSHACTPTSISMITEYYHSVDVSNKGLSPLDLIQMQEPDAESYSMRTGSNANWFFDDLNEAGYTISYNQNKNTISSLQEQLTGGPVLALIKQSSGANHAVVVTGAQNGYVSIADPWQGVNRTYTEQQFVKMWKGLDDGWLVSIRPEAKAAAL